MAYWRISSRWRNASSRLRAMAAATNSRSVILFSGITVSHGCVVSKFTAAASETTTPKPHTSASNTTNGAAASTRLKITRFA